MKVENFKRFFLKMLPCEARVFPVGTAYGYMISRPFFYSAENAHAYMNLDHMTSGRFVLGREVHCEFDYWPLAVSMPPTKVCPQCKAAVPGNVNDVIMSFDPNEKQSVICTRKL